MVNKMIALGISFADLPTKQIVDSKVDELERFYKYHRSILESKGNFI